jgi:uncharacterized protein YbaP (TraB family)
MTNKVRVCTAVLTMMLFCGITLAQEPVLDISPKVHPNLAQAQRLVAEANKYIEKAQVANKGDMQGHAEKARQLLADANRELKAAAEAANAANASRQKRKR